MTSSNHNNKNMEQHKNVIEKKNRRNRINVFIQKQNDGLAWMCHTLKYESSQQKQPKMWESLIISTIQMHNFRKQSGHIVWMIDTIKFKDGDNK